MSDEEGDLTKEELMANYQMLFIKWSKLTRVYTAGETKRSALMQKNHELMKYTWVEFIKEKSNTFEVFKQLATQIQREKEVSIVAIRSDLGESLRTRGSQGRSLMSRVMRVFSRLFQEQKSSEGIQQGHTVNTNPDDQIEEAPTVKPIDDDSGIEPVARI
ncbi:hypothetical protein LIER_13239 [Lithospermum erythrorhizon]|uniref:Uncharacterized protein n=1 Tax=Lithospermum erythrorhizon TaxID=34254 RepID=A0AAV3PV52_LITER